MHIISKLKFDLTSKIYLGNEYEMELKQFIRKKDAAKKWNWLRSKTTPFKKYVFIIDEYMRYNC